MPSLLDLDGEEYNDLDVEKQSDLPLDVVNHTATHFNVGRYTVFSLASEITESEVDFEKDYLLYLRYKMIPLYVLQYCRKVMK